MWKPWISRYGLLLSLISAGCSDPSEDRSSTTSPVPSFFILEQSGTELDATFRERFAEYADEASLDSIRSPAATPLVLTTPERMTGEERKAAFSVLRAGGSILAFHEETHPSQLACPPSGLTVHTDLDESSAEPISALANFAEWEAPRMENRLLSSLQSVPSGPGQLPRFRIELEAGWQKAALSKAMPPETLPDEILHLYARSPNTEAPWVISLETETERFFQCVLPLQPTWRLFSLSPGAFLNVETGEALSSFKSVQQITLGRDPGAYAPPDIPLVLECTPFFAFAEPHAPTVHFLRDACARSPAPMRSPFAFDRGTDLQLLREIPLPGEFSGRLFWVPESPDTINRQTLAHLLLQINRLSASPARLLQCVPLHPAERPLSPLPIRIELGVASGFEGSLALQAFIEDPQEREISRMPRQVLPGPFEEPHKTLEVSLPGFTRQDWRNRSYRLTVLLEDASSGEVLDRKKQPVRVFPDPPDVDERFFLQSNVTIFRIGRNGLFLNCIDYTPSAFSAAVSDWTDPAFYPAEVLETDLARIAEASFNSIRVSLPSLNHPYSFRAFSDAVLQEGLLVVLRLPDLRLDHLEETIEEFARISGLLDAPHITALEIPASAIRREVISLDLKAHPALPVMTNTPLSIDADRLGPDHESEETLIRALCNRLAGQYISAWRRSIETAGLHQMVTIETVPDPYQLLPESRLLPFDFRAAIGRVDYQTISGEGLVTASQRREDGPRLARIVRGLSRGAPVMWTGLTAPITRPSTDAQKSHQKTMHQAGLDMAVASHAASSSARRYRDRCRPLDYGLWDSTGTAQPAVQVYTAFSNEMRTRRQTPVPWTGFHFDTGPTGFAIAELLHRHRATVQADAQELRHPLYRKLSTQIRTELEDISPLSLSTVLDNEWLGALDDETDRLPQPGRLLRLDRRTPLTLSLSNVGQATWAASETDRFYTIWIRAEQENTPPVYLPLPEVEPGESATVQWRPNAYGRFTLTPWLWGIGAFGTPLRVEIPLETNPNL